MEIKPVRDDDKNYVIHIEIPVKPQPPAEKYVFFAVGKRLVFLIEQGVFFVVDQMCIRDSLGEPKNLEEQGLKLVGKDVFEKLIKGYTEKQWGKPCNELPAFIIRRIPLRFTYDNNYFNDRYQGIPEGGYTRLAEKLSEGCDVRLSTEYSEFIKEYPDIAEKTVYTGMIDQFYGYRFGELEYRSLRFETERLDAEDFQGNAVVNYTEREIPYTRIICLLYTSLGKKEKN